MPNTDTNTTNVVNLDGDIVSLPSSSVAKALQAGYRIPTAAEQTSFNNQQKYGVGTANELKAFGLGLGRGATFGGTDYLATKVFGAKPEDISGLKEYNPTSSIGGEIIGAVAPSLLAPESIAGRTPVGLLGKGAKIAEESLAGIGKVAAKLAPEGSLAARGLETAGHITAKALAGAGEGAAFGAGQAFSEDALGNPEPLGESLLTNMGYGAAWGGGLGGLVGIGESAIPKLAQATRAASSKAYSTILGKEAEPVLNAAGEVINKGERDLGAAQELYSKASSALTGKPIEDIQAPLRNPEAHKLFTPQERSQLTRGAAADFNDFIKTSDKLTNATINEHKPAAIHDLLEGAPIAPANNATTKILGEADRVVRTLATDPDIYYQPFAKEIKNSYEGMLSRLDENSTAADHFNEIERFKRKVQDLFQSNKNKQADKIIASLPLVNELAQLGKTTLEDETVWGRAAALQQQINSAYKSVADAKKLALKSLGEKDPISGKMISAPTKFETFFNGANKAKGQQTLERLNNYRDAVKDFTEKAESIHQAAGVEYDKKALQDIITKNYKNVDTGAKRWGENPDLYHGFFSDLKTMHLPIVGNLPAKIAESVVNALRNPEFMAGKLANIHGAAQTVSKSVDKIAKRAFEPIIAGAEASKEAAKKVLEKEDVEKQIKETTDKVQSVDHMQQHLENSTKAISGVAPKITSALQRTMINGALFLHSKIPDWSDNTSQAPMDAPKSPTPEDNTKWARYYNSVHDPMAVMSAAVNGSVKPEEIETLQAVYPNLYANMKQSLISEIVSKKSKNPDISIPYQKRLAINDFLGVSLDSTLNPMNVMANQAILSSKANEKKQQESSMIKPTQKGLDNIDLAGRYKTPMQSSIKRDEA